MPSHAASAVDASLLSVPVSNYVNARFRGTVLLMGPGDYHPNLCRWAGLLWTRDCSLWCMVLGEMEDEDRSPEG